jgi:hypothetical protein
MVCKATSRIIIHRIGKGDIDPDCVIWCGARKEKVDVHVGAVRNVRAAVEVRPHTNLHSIH